MSLFLHLRSKVKIPSRAHFRKRDKSQDLLKYEGGMRSKVAKLKFQSFITHKSENLLAAVRFSSFHAIRTKVSSIEG
eukprot:Awhi_evm1s2418